MNALMIIGHNGFRDEEYIEPRKVLEEKGIEITVASTSTDEAIGKLGMRVKPDITIDEVNHMQYDVVVFIGGPGCKEYFDNKIAHKICQERVRHNKMLAAICSAPVILAKAGILKNVLITCWEGDVAACESYGAKVSGRVVEIDKNIVTGNGPKAAKEFGIKITEVLGY